jgi:hypothetical protein
LASGLWPNIGDCHTIVAIALPEEGTPAMLLAVENSQRISGTDRLARATFSLDDSMLRAGVSLWSIFERDFCAVSTQRDGRCRNDVRIRRRHRTLGCARRPAGEDATKTLRIPQSLWPRFSFLARLSRDVVALSLTA